MPFDDVQLLYGENQISIVLYGPQGQIRTREEMINVGQENVPPGKTWYWAGANQPDRDVVAFRESVEALLLPKAQAAVSLEHGLDERTSVGAIARAMLVGDERVTFVEGSVRRSIGPALVEVAGGVGKRRRPSGARSVRCEVREGERKWRGCRRQQFPSRWPAAEVGEGLPALGRHADHASGERSSPHIPM